MENIANLDEILLTKPSLNKENMRRIYLKAKSKNIEILEIPSIEEIANGQLKIDSLKPISIEKADRSTRNNIPI